MTDFISRNVFKIQDASILKEGEYVKQSTLLHEGEYGKNGDDELHTFSGHAINQDTVVLDGDDKLLTVDVKKQLGGEDWNAVFAGDSVVLTNGDITGTDGTTSQAILVNDIGHDDVVTINGTITLEQAAAQRQAQFEGVPAADITEGMSANVSSAYDAERESRELLQGIRADALEFDGLHRGDRAVHDVANKAQAKADAIWGEALTMMTLAQDSLDRLRALGVSPEQLEMPHMGRSIADLVEVSSESIVAVKYGYDMLKQEGAATEDPRNPRQPGDPDPSEIDGPRMFIKPEESREAAIRMVFSLQNLRLALEEAEKQAQSPGIPVGNHQEVPEQPTNTQIKEEPPAIDLIGDTDRNIPL